MAKQFISRLNRHRTGPPAARGVHVEPPPARAGGGDWRRSRGSTSKPKLNPLSAESRKQRRLWEEDHTAMIERKYERDQKLDEMATKAELAVAQHRISTDSVTQDAVASAHAADLVARMNQRAGAAAINGGRVLGVYASDAIDFLDKYETADPDVVEPIKAMIRVVAKEIAHNWASAALGRDFDALTEGGGH